jgi:exopolyphosphatase/guanosine-5'-triphosphate,3'-diphosphate pyrophosphatase
MRLAVIDCGTNTFNLIIIDVHQPDGSGTRNYTRLFQTRIPVKLGEGAINLGFIAPGPFQRGLAAIEQLKEIMQANRVTHVSAFATSAIRDAKNGPDFVSQIREKFDIGLNVIDGDREAELIYLGVREALPLSGQVSLIMDIGGGSTEFILANDQGMLWRQSFRIGAARLLERFSPSDPIAAHEVEGLYRYLEQELQPLFAMAALHGPVELVGSSGAFDSLVEMICGELGGEPLMDSKTEYEVDLAQYFKVSELVKRSTLEERRLIKGLVPMRFDMIVISCLMVDFILKNLNLSRLRVSTYSLKEGALADFINKQL